MKHCVEERPKQRTDLRTGRKSKRGHQTFPIERKLVDRQRGVRGQQRCEALVHRVVAARRSVRVGESKADRNQRWQLGQGDPREGTADLPVAPRALRIERRFADEMHQAIAKLGGKLELVAEGRGALRTERREQDRIAHDQLSGARIERAQHPPPPFSILIRARGEDRRDPREQPGAQQETRAAAGRTAAREQLVQLVADALAGDLVEGLEGLGDRACGAKLQRQPQRGREADCPQGAQAVLGEAIVRLADAAEDPAMEIGDASEGIAKPLRACQAIALTVKSRRARSPSMSPRNEIELGRRPSR
jgi:hypothetical protein